MKRKISIHFLSHFARTGSTFLCDRLSRNKRILIIPESKMLTIISNEFHSIKNKDKKFISDLINKLYDDKKFLDYKFSKKNFKKFMSSSKINNWQNFFFNVCMYYKKQYKSRADIIIFKKKETSKYFLEFQKEFKDSKIIFMIRDPRGIFFSSKRLKHSVTGKFFFKNVFDLSIKYNLYLEEMKNVFKNSNKDYLIVKYEVLIDNFNYQFKKVLSLLKVREVNLKFLKIQHYKKNIITKRDRHLHVNVTKKIIRNNNQKWKNNISKYQRFLIYILCYFNINYLNYKY